MATSFDRLTRLIGGSLVRRGRDTLAPRSANERAFTFDLFPGALAFVPEGYEPGYAYPLFVWLHEEGGSERDLLRIMPHLSTRNFVALALRGTLPACSGPPGGFRWPEPEAFDAVEQQFARAVQKLSGSAHVHPGRIYAAGQGEGAAVALHLLTARPHWLNGAVALDTCCQPTLAASATENAQAKSEDSRFLRRCVRLTRFRELRGKRVLLTSRPGRGVSAAHDSRRLARLLRTAGMDVSLRRGAGRGFLKQALAETNDWLMAGIRTAVKRISESV